MARNDDLHNRPASGSNGTGGAADALDALLDRVTAAVRDMPIREGLDEQTLAGTVAALREADAATLSTFNGITK